MYSIVSTRGAGVALEHVGDEKPIVVREIGPDLGEHLGFALVVHLLADRLRELLGEILERERPGVVDEVQQEEQRATT